MDLKSKRIGLSSFQLHLFAMFFMLIDHIGTVFFPFNFTFRYIGRLAFPIFCYLLVQGFYKTSNKKKYFLRLFLFAIISEIPFDLVFNNSFDYMSSQNVLWSFCISFSMMCIIERLKYKYVYLFPFVIFIFSFIAYLLKVDYSWYGVLTVLIFYITYDSNVYLRYILQFIGMVIINSILFKGTLVIYGEISLYTQFFAIFSLFFIWLCSGKKGKYNNYIKYFNYFFYPIHMIFLYLLKFLLMYC